MVSLTIDGRRISVEPGSTVLDAAKWLGIRIPTMCHVPGIEPATGCFLCAVQIEGRRTLSPACGMPVAEGMAVVTGSEDVRTARKMALELLLSDHAGECVAPCAAQCPAGLDIPGFVYGIATGDHRRSMEVIAERLALPGSLGRICPRLCERQCRRSDFDQGLAIGALHRYVADLDGGLYAPPRAPSTGKRVAIVGAGPAGLAAAYYLAKTAMTARCSTPTHSPEACCATESPPTACRRMRWMRRSTQSGSSAPGSGWASGGVKHFTLAGLRQRHDAVFVAIGAQRAEGLRCEGEEHALAGIEFLEQVASGNPSPLGNDVAVVGGGNTAMDCARSAVRLGARNVRVLYRRSRQEMPCLMDEVEAAEAEGVHIELLVAPVRLERNGESLLLTCRRMTLGEPDASGRRRPVALDGSDFTMECSTVVAAIGQSVDRSLAEREGLGVTAWGIAADERTLATNLPGVFAGGDGGAGRGSGGPCGGRGENGRGCNSSVPVGRSRHR